jgi:hypothetical protein
MRVMAKTLVQLTNGLRVKYLVRPKRFFLFNGSACVKIDNRYQTGFDTQADAERRGSELVARPYSNIHWETNRNQ